MANSQPSAGILQRFWLTGDFNSGEMPSCALPLGPKILNPNSQATRIADLTMRFYFDDACAGR